MHRRLRLANLARRRREQRLWIDIAKGELLATNQTARQGGRDNRRQECSHTALLYPGLPHVAKCNCATNLAIHLN